MYSQMHLQGSAARKLVVTKFAQERSFPTVNSEMCNYVTALGEIFITQIARKRPYSTAYSQINVQCRASRKHSFKKFARKSG
jgi:hypothetical protein